MVFNLFDDTPKVGPFTILTVCTGNICRSPLAETVLRQVLQRLPITVHSSGTHALVGSPMTEQNQEIARELGVTDGAEHRARQIELEHVRDADLILALSREHRRAVVELLPKAARTTFTIREFARLTEALAKTKPDFSHIDDAGARMREAVKAVAQMRGTVVAPADAEADDVVDPYRQSDQVYKESADQLIPAVNTTAALLRYAAQNVAG